MDLVHMPEFVEHVQQVGFVELFLDLCIVAGRNDVHFQNRDAFPQIDFLNAGPCTFSTIFY